MDKFLGELQKGTLNHGDIKSIKSTINMPTLFMMIGLPASGKSFFAHNHIESNDERRLVIHSSDDLRRELYNDINDQEHNQELFTTLHRRIKADLIAGYDVVYDATNINKIKRIAFLEELKNIKCYKVAILMATEYNRCQYRNQERDRDVPNTVIKKMYENFNPPSYTEGFNRILIQTSIGQMTPFITSNFIHRMMHYDQNNKHHKLTLGEHMIKTWEYVKTKRDDKAIQYAALMHDCGKPVVRTFDKELNAHYYNHHCVGAYDSFCYTYSMNFSDEDRLYIANLIYYHMHPMINWRQSEKTLKRDKSIISNDMFRDIEVIHVGDKKAHK